MEEHKVRHKLNNLKDMNENGNLGRYCLLDQNPSNAKNPYFRIKLLLSLKTERTK